MPQVSVRFYAELNDFLPEKQQGKQLSVELDRRTSIKDMLEALGVPHTEIMALIVNGESVGFDYIVAAGDHISVYPPFAEIDIHPLQKLGEYTQGEFRFVLDCHLGRLARYLRQCGFDTLYQNDFDDDQLAQISSAEQRILLTRDRSLLKRSTIEYGYFVRATDPRKQLDEIIQRYRLKDQIRPFGRCTLCNGTVEPVDKQAIDSLLEPKTRKHYDTFWQCSNCQQIYWEGSHVEKMQRVTKDLLH
jgi:uncharacterized protein with PIN domain/sulfur carrier protein ThiS